MRHKAFLPRSLGTNTQISDIIYSFSFFSFVVVWSFGLAPQSTDPIFEAFHPYPLPRVSGGGKSAKIREVDEEERVSTERRNEYGERERERETNKVEIAAREKKMRAKREQR